MDRPYILFLFGSFAFLVCSTGCGLKEIRGKTKFGPSFRHKASDRSDSVRWTVQQRIGFKWDKGIRTGLTYRRRDTDDGNGNNDNVVFFDVSYPLWKAGKKPDSSKQPWKKRMKKKMKKLEKRVAELEALLEQSGEP